MIAKAAACAHCRAGLDDTDPVLHGCYDTIELPPVRPVVIGVERYAGRCRRCGGTTLAAVPDGLEPGSPFGISILTLALYLRFTHAISYRRLTRLFLHLFALDISEGSPAIARRSGSPISMAPQEATPRSGRSAWPINSVTSATPSRPATPSLLPA